MFIPKAMYSKRWESNDELSQQNKLDQEQASRDLVFVSRLTRQERRHHEERMEQRDLANPR